MYYKMNPRMWIMLSCIVTQAVSWLTWNSNCYYFSSDELSYSLASDACGHLYSYLVEAESTLEHDELVKTMSTSKHYWAGIQRNINNDYYWVHSGSPVQNSLWVNYAPNDNADCARFRGDSNGKLDDKSCAQNFNYICEKTEDENAEYFCDGNQLHVGNIAYGKPSSSNNSTSNSALAVDGITGTCTVIGSGLLTWWQVDLGGHYSLNNIVITSSHGEELQDLEIVLYSMNPSIYGPDANYTVCALFVGPVKETSVTIQCSYETVGRWLRIVKSSVLNTDLILCEIEVYGVTCSKNQGNSTCEKPVIKYNVTPFPTTTETPTTQYHTTTAETTGEKTTTETATTTTAITITTTTLTRDTPTTDFTSGQYDITASEITTDETSSTGSTYHITDTTVSVSITTNIESTSNMSTECYCPCSNTQNVTEEELAELIDKIKKELTVDLKSTNAYIRTLTSADDVRPSARGVGSLGLVMLIITLLFFVSGDIVNLGAYLYSKIRILKKRKHYGIRY